MNEQSRQNSFENIISTQTYGTHAYICPLCRGNAYIDGKASGLIWDAPENHELSKCNHYTCTGCLTGIYEDYDSDIEIECPVCGDDWEKFILEFGDD